MWLKSLPIDVLVDSHLKNVGSCTRHTISAKISLKETESNSHCGSAVMNLTSIHEDAGSIPGLTQWIKDLALL